jgi:hypothetical protein
MTFRFQKRIRILKGLTLNLSKSGTSWTLGGKGASINVRGDKATGNVGIPGTGASYRERFGSSPEPKMASGPRSSGGRFVFLLLVVTVLGAICFLR